MTPRILRPPNFLPGAFPGRAVSAVAKETRSCWWPPQASAPIFTAWRQWPLGPQLPEWQHGQPASTPEGTIASGDPSAPQPSTWVSQVSIATKWFGFGIESIPVYVDKGPAAHVSPLRHRLSRANTQLHRGALLRPILAKPRYYGRAAMCSSDHAPSALPSRSGRTVSNLVCDLFPFLFNLEVKLAGILRIRQEFHAFHCFSWRCHGHAFSVKLLARESVSGSVIWCVVLMVIGSTLCRAFKPPAAQNTLFSSRAFELISQASGTIQSAKRRPGYAVAGQ